MPKVDRNALESAKRESLGQVLMRSARLYNELALRRLNAGRSVPFKPRVAHTALLPHISFEGVRVTDLAQKVGVTKQAVSQLVSEMATDGVVELVVDPSDARAKLVRFTPKGADGILRGLDALRDVEGDLRRRVGEKRLTSLKRDLDAVLLALEAAMADG